MDLGGWIHLDSMFKNRVKTWDDGVWESSAFWIFGSGPRAHFDANDRAATRRSTC